MAGNQHLIEYAIRYCITRDSYAFEDGLDVADANWATLSAATQRDVLDAIHRGRPEPGDLNRWRTLSAAYYAASIATPGVSA